ncbi:MAG: metallophosphoesterase family protein [Planctomycetota bacterium]
MEDTESPPSVRTHPRNVLFAAILFVILASALYFVAPWVLPVRIVEGPMVQQADENAVTLVWYTTRPLEPGQCQVSIQTSDDEYTLPAEAEGRRHRLRIDELSPGQAYPYRIKLGRRTLAQATLHTNKPAGQPFSFVVFGDSGKGTQAQYLLAARMWTDAIVPDFMLHTGDLIYGEGERFHYKDRFFTPYRHLLAEVNFWPCLGNHDIGNYKIPAEKAGQAYFEVFELPDNGPPAAVPECNYWFDYASARIAVIDSNKEHDEATLAEQVVPWLEEVFADCDATWKFVSLHHPLYTSGAYQEEPRLQNTLVPVFERLGVDIAFSGHDHMYQRMLPISAGQLAPDGDGVVYVITGAGGARLYDAIPPDQRPPYLAALYNEVHSFTYVQIDGHELRLQQISVDGDILDEWSMTKVPSDTATRPTDSAENPDSEP